MKKGFTLIELLVYMAIMGFIIVVAGKVFSDATGMRVRSQNMLSSAEEVGKISNMILEDISQMGTKSWGRDTLKNSANIYLVSATPDSTSIYVNATERANAITMGTQDFSSFKLFKGTNFDSLVFLKSEFNDTGKFLAVREVAWYVDRNRSLFRSCRTKFPTTCRAGDTDCANGTCPIGDSSKAIPVFIADSIRTFRFTPSAPGVRPQTAGTSSIPGDTIFPINETNGHEFHLLTRSTAGDGVESVQFEHVDNEQASLSRIFAYNKKDDGTPDDRAVGTASKQHNEVYLVDDDDNSQTDCVRVPIKRGDAYIVEFNMPFVIGNVSYTGEAKKDSNFTQFVPGKDHLAVGLRYTNGDTIPEISQDVLLYPSQYQYDDGNTKAQLPRYAEFIARDNPKAPDNICVALTLSFYSPQAYKGKFTFSDFKVYKKQTGAYHFVKEKNNYTKAFAETYATEAAPAITAGIPRQTHKKNVKAFELLLEISNRGEVAGTYSGDSTGMAIPVPNNGVTYK